MLRSVVLVLVLVLASSEGVAAITAGATLAGAAGLAGVTVYTTLRRFKEDRESQERELDAEARRHAQTLRHAREMADVADLRSLLDDATLVLDSARAARAKAGGAMRGAVKEKGADAGRLMAHRQELKAAADAARTILARLTVRLGAQDSMTAAFRDAESALRDMVLQMILMAGGRTEDIRETRRSRFSEKGIVLTNSADRFSEAAVKRAGSIIAEAEP
jgi:hypothetical protein